MKISKLIYSLLINLVLLVVTSGVTLLILSHYTFFLTEGLEIGIFIIPVFTVIIGILVALLAWGTRVVKRFLTIIPSVVLSIVIGGLIISYGPDFVRAHHEQQWAERNGVQTQQEDRLHLDAPVLDLDALYAKLPKDQELELRDVQVLPNQEFKYWVRASSGSATHETSYIGYFDQRNGYRLSQLKTLDELWKDVQNQQHLTTDTLAQVEWDLKNSQIELTGRKDSSKTYRVFLMSDGTQVKIDHLEVIHK